MVLSSVCYQLRVHARMEGWLLLQVIDPSCCSSTWSDVFVVGVSWMVIWCRLGFLLMDWCRSVTVQYQLATT